MPDSTWLGKLTLALIAAATFLFMAGAITGLLFEQYAKVHQTNIAYQKNAESDRDAASQEIAKSCFNADFSVMRDCVTHELKTYYEKQARNEDLKAQQDMALWAYWLLWATGFSILISLAGLYLLLDSLRQTRRSISDTREIGQAQIRAYVNCVSATIEICDGIVKVNPVFQNTGNSPTSPLSIDANIIFGSKNTLLNISLGLSGKVVKSSIGECPSIPSGDSKAGKIMAFGEGISPELKLLGPGHFTVDAKAIWYDIFGEMCSMKFILEIEHITHQRTAEGDVVYTGTMTARNESPAVLRKQEK
jgi:CHASE3 domain sensor protein